MSNLTLYWAGQIWPPNFWTQTTKKGLIDCFDNFDNFWIAILIIFCLKTFLRPLPCPLLVASNRFGARVVSSEHLSQIVNFHRIIDFQRSIPEVFWEGTPRDAHKKFLMGRLNSKKTPKYLVHEGSKKFLGAYEAINIFEKFLKISKQNFWNFFKIEKTVILVLKLVQNYHVDQNWTKFSLKTPKSAIFL